ncbi:MAG: hypothetical protein ACI9QL_004940 [Candidatus Omnitrophota bacterium]|jgi:hypothetical protein
MTDLGGPGRAQPTSRHFRTMKLNLILAVVMASGMISYGQNPATPYSFFVAGHTYGEPGVDNVGFHPPFRQKFGYLQSRPEIAFGVLTGDIVFTSTAQNWDEVDADIESLNLPVYFAVGNHDISVGSRALFEDRYGSTYYSFTHQNDLFIVLDPNLNKWRITGAQLIFLRGILADKAADADNIYVFFHQILWREDDNPFSYIQWNSDAGRATSINFWTDVAPLFYDLPNKVWMFAGDLGAAWTTNVTYDQYKNLTFIATGMGDQDGENFIVVNVADDKSVEYDLICLSDTNTACLGSLESHLEVQYIPPTIEHFVVNPENVASGETVNVSWAVRNAIGVRIEPDIGPVSTNGVLNLPMDATTLFTLTATNTLGSVAASALATVEGTRVDLEITQFTTSTDAMETFIVRMTGALIGFRYTLERNASLDPAGWESVESQVAIGPFLEFEYQLPAGATRQHLRLARSP